ncbi:hypothetical protein M885DRAFT_559613 [Pelagophyceae sp. CCMP2097]|nr:hypothetical protein M885DRAFT_559613 [Pelagophyceae sp. CCMP2097]
MQRTQYIPLQRPSRRRQRQIDRLASAADAPLDAPLDAPPRRPQTRPPAARAAPVVVSDEDDEMERAAWRRHAMHQFALIMVMQLGPHVVGAASLIYFREEVFSLGCRALGLLLRLPLAGTAVAVVAIFAIGVASALHLGAAAEPAPARAQSKFPTSREDWKRGSARPGETEARGGIGGRPFH